MATSGSVSTTSYEGRYYTLSWTATQSVANNQSTVSWTLKSVGGSSSWYAERTLKVVLGGSTVYSKTARVERYAETIATGTKTITHDSNGDASFSVSIEAAVYTSSVNCTGSKSFTLNNIPRKSTLTVSNGTLGTAQTLTVTRKSTSFTHTITATCGSASETIATKSSTTSFSFTPPLTWASQNTTGTSVSVKYTITTYNGSASIGSNSYTVTCSVPSSVAPTVTFTVTDASGYLSTYGGYVQGKSKFSINITASGSSGSAISTYKTTVDGKSYTTSSFTTSEITGSGTLPISVTVTDSRGRTATTSQNVTVLGYESPKITASNVKRSTSSGAASSSGSYLTVTFSSEIASLNNKNGVTYKVRYKKKSETSFSNPVTLTSYTGRYSVTNGTYTFAADTSSSYDIIISATDSFGSVERSLVGSSIKKLWSVFTRDRGLAFGKFAELENTVDFGFDTFFRGKNVFSSPSFGQTIFKRSEGSNGAAIGFENANEVLGYVGMLGSEGNTLVKWSADTVNHWNVLDSGNFAQYAFPVGSCYSTSTYTNPSSFLGGTWALIGKTFTSYAESNANAFTINKTNVSSMESCLVTRFGNCLQVRLNLITSVALADGAVELGTFNFDYLGCSDLLMARYPIATTDGGNGIAQCDINYTTGLLRSIDVVTKTSGGTIAAGSSILLEIVVVLNSGRMLDSVCSEFKWKRTA